MKSTHESFLMLQGNYNELEKELSQIKAKLEGSESLYDALSSEHKELQTHDRTIQEENSKFRINNARLLMKLEN